MAESAITLAAVRSLLCGGAGYPETHGVGLAMALDAMTSASRDLSVATDALYHDDVNLEDVQSLVFRVAQQLDVTAGICWRIAQSQRTGAEISRESADGET